MRYLLIENSGIDPNHCAYSCPWEYDTTCYNYKTPDEAVNAADIDTIDFLDDIHTLVIKCDLEDYSFISKMSNLRQL